MSEKFSTSHKKPQQKQKTNVSGSEVFSGGSRNFRIGYLSRRGRILGLGDCCDTPSHVHIPYVFVMRVENIKYILYALYVDVLCSQNLQPFYTPPPQMHWGRMPAASVLDPALVLDLIFIWNGIKLKHNIIYLHSDQYTTYRLLRLKFKLDCKYVTKM